MAFRLTELLQSTYRRLGQTTTAVITGGSKSTAVNTAWQDVYQDDDLNNGTLFVIKDSAGAGAAPEGEMAPITDYDEASYTMTLSPELSAALASGDKIVFTRAIWPMYEMIEIVNDALKAIGDITLVDTSLTTATDQTEYALPIGLKRGLVKVEMQTNDDSNDNRWVEIPFEVIPAAPGSAGLIKVPQLDDGYTLKLWYNGQHPRVEDYDDVIAESIDPELAIAATINRAMEWYMDRTGSVEEHYVQRANKAMDDYENALRKFPVNRTKRKSKLLVFDKAPQVVE